MRERPTTRPAGGGGALTLSGQYEVREALGSGGMGVVHRAHDTLLGRDVAIKFLRPQQGDDSRAIDRLHREAQLVSRLNHPHIVTLHAFGRAEDGTPFLVMEHVTGGTLKEYFESRGRLSAANARAIGLAMAGALDTAHSAGIVHRDLKPSNVLMSSHSQGAPHPKIADFGLAKAFVATQEVVGDATQPGVIVGSPAFMAPEQTLGQSMDPRVDIYAMGVLLYQMLTGTLPVHGSTALEWAAAHRTVVPAPPRTACPEADIPQALSELVARCLEKEPADRFADGGELYRALAALSQVGSPEWTEAAASPAARPEPRPAHIRTVAALVVRLVPPASSDEPEALEAAADSLDRVGRGDPLASRATRISTTPGTQQWVFGLPIARESDAEHAVTAALSVCAALAEQGIGAAAGVETGRCVVRYRSDGAVEQVLGEATLGATALAFESEAGVRLGSGALAACRGQFVVRTTDGRHAVLAPAPRSMRGLARADGPRWFGPTGPIEALVSSMRSGLDAGTTAHAVIGPGGVGKTRVVQEAAARLAEAGVRAVVHVVELSELPGAPFAAFGAALRAEFARGEDDPATSLTAGPMATQTLHTAALGTDDERALREWIGLDAELSQTAGDGLQTATASADAMVSASEEVLLSLLIRTYRHLAARAGLVVVIDNYQWAEGTDSDLVFALATELDRERLSIVLAGRNAAADVRELFEDTNLDVPVTELRPLSLDDARDLARTALADPHAADERAVEAVVRAGERTPATLLQLAASYSDRARSLGEVSARIHVPWSKTDAAPRILARSDGLPEARRRVLMAAAAAGVVFWDEQVARMVESSAEPTTARWHLARLREAGWIRKRRTSRVAGAIEYGFAEAQAVPVLRAHTLSAQLKEWRSTSADWLRPVAEASPADLLGPLAEHYDGAGRNDEATAAYLRASNHARRRLDIRSATRYLHRWLEIAAPDQPNRIDVEWSLATSHLQLGEVQSARTLAESIRSAPAVNPSLASRAQELLGTIELQSGDLAAAAELFEAAIESEPSASRRAGLAARALQVRLRSGDWPACRSRADEELARLAAEVDDPDDPARLRAEALLLNARGTAERRAGDLSPAKATYELALERLQALDDYIGVGVALNNLAVVAYARGELDAAERGFAGAAERYERASALGHEALARSNLGEVLIERGRAPDAIRHLDRAIRLHRLVRATVPLADALRNRAAAALAVGDRDGARGYGADALRTAKRAAAPWLEKSVRELIDELNREPEET